MSDPYGLGMSDAAHRYTDLMDRWVCTQCGSDGFGFHACQVTGSTDE